jgi:predicted HNH restriction endonuclease
LSSDQGVVMHYHHVDYSKPLEVIPVCAGCHKLWHAAQNSSGHQ